MKHSIVRSFLILCLGVLGCSAVQAAITVYEFKNETQQERFNLLIDDLRCPKCQNQNVAGSDAPIAIDIKDRVYSLMQQGKTNEQILEHMVARYGEYINYRPPVDARTYVLWFGPFAIMAITLAILIPVIRRRQRQVHQNVDKQRLQQILKTYGSSDENK